MKIVAISVLVTVLAAPAVAQQLPPVAPPYHPAIDNPQVRAAFDRTYALNAAAGRADRFESNFNFAYFDRQMAYWRATHNPRRIRRAEAAAALINGGDCEGAKAIAVRDSDERLVTRIEQVCAQIEISDPQAAAAGR
ncbi:hypothetical protein [Brevundimonas sp. NIBR11]|uniref:hypothetical protein n=1 Tax=Brevundimonas sp. NIBR11 TaxID=3015999 RepID=UPI0022F00971|nr:hypothetical protein [Brevundimonas sp. NIBR11]WGM32601.1 hypothetical protein KKHFBJBL_02855 [Brevundimonas sp. NIBR11]